MSCFVVTSNLSGLGGDGFWGSSHKSCCKIFPASMTDVADDGKDTKVGVEDG
jgi:hypothetical protein